MIKRSKLFLDREISPTNRAIYWTEYVIRNKGAHHLQSAAVHLNLMQLVLLDVVSFLILIIATIILILYFIIRYVFRKVCRSKSKCIDQKKKNN